MNNKKNTRMCLICRERLDKSLLTKIVMSEENSIKIDEFQKENKRGVYICSKKECIEKLEKRKNIVNTFKITLNESKINVNEQDLKNILEKLKGGKLVERKYKQK